MAMVHCLGIGLKFSEKHAAQFYVVVFITLL